MTRPISTYQQRKAWRQRAKAQFEAELTEPTPPVALRKSRFGFNPTHTTTTETQMAIRRDNAMRRRKVKPSMPKMPWDGNAEEDAKP